MGGLKQYMPITYWTFLLASLSISGVPGLAGFFSKDEILLMPSTPLWPPANSPGPSARWWPS